jgi:replicative DNA helicase
MTDFRKTRIESLILENLLYDEHYCSLVGIFLQPEYFKEVSEKQIFLEIQNHIKEYNESPSVESLANILSNRTDLNQTIFDNCLENLHRLGKEKSHDPEWLLSETEKWAKDQAVYNGIVQSISILEGKDKKSSKDAIPEILTEALAISLDKSIGHNYIENGDDRWEFYHKTESKIPFDMVMLDKITNGGISPKTLTVLLGGTGVGKTLVKTHLASQYLKQGLDVLYITMEMAEERIAERIDANLLDIDLYDLHRLDKKTFEQKLNNLKIGKLIIKEYPTAGAHTGNFRALIRELKIKKGFTPKVIILDYLNICSSSRVKWAANMNTYIYIKSIAEEIRGLAVECNVPIITSSQLNREGFTSSDPDLSNTSESFGLPATADLMLAIMAKDDGSGVNNQILFKQLKNRYSDISINAKFLVKVVKKKMKLYDIEEVNQPVLANDGSNKYYDKKSDANTNSNPYKFTVKPQKRGATVYEDWKF